MLAFRHSALSRLANAMLQIIYQGLIGDERCNFMRYIVDVAPGSSSLGLCRFWSLSSATILYKAFPGNSPNSRNLPIDTLSMRVMTTEAAGEAGVPRPLKQPAVTSFPSRRASLKPLMRIETMRSVAVITGASTGIGWASAKVLLDRGFRVFGSVRKQADADRLQSEFGVNFTPLIFDVTDEAAVLAARARGPHRSLTAKRWPDFVATMPASRSPAPCSNSSAVDKFRRQMEVNFIGPVIATQAFRAVAWL